MPQDIDFLTAPWISGSQKPDPNGPLDVPFTPYDEAWSDRPIIDVIAEVARRRPQHVAIDDGTTRLTYAQLYAMACRLSHAISRAKLAPGPVGVALPNNVFYIVGMLGCLAAGRACMLLSQDNPPDYNRRLIVASGLRALLVNGEEAGRALEGGDPPLIDIGSALLDTGYAESSPAGRLGVDEPTFIVSTSGSTGVPKLLARSQRALHGRLAIHVHAGHYNENDRILSLAAPAIGAAVTQRFLPLMIGATLHIVDVPRVGMGGILKTLRDSRITCARMTPSLIKALSKLDDASTYMAAVRLATGGGEMLLQKDLAQIRAILPPGCRFMHSLGMTETAVARWFVPERDDHDPVRVAAGYISPETDVLVLDEDGRPCSPGEIGELIVRSASVVLGEWRDGALLPDRFERDPSDSTKRIYRTGDLVRLCPDGVLVVHGRKDRMIKIRGQRVEPAVIEATMRSVPGVADAAVATKQDDGGSRIYGFVVASKPDGVTSQAQSGGELPAMVRAALETLPLYMRPYDILVLDALPISATNKVDSRALLDRIAALEGAQCEIAESAPAVAPIAASHQARDWVADAWRGAFGAEKNPVLGFDAAGGDSLQFMQIIFRLEQLSGVPVPIGIFDVTMRQDDMACSLDRYLQGDAAEVSSSRRKIFLIPGVGGDEPRLLRFRAGCAPDISLVCLEYGDWAQWVEQQLDLEAIVQRMVARIQELAPTGRLSLAGYSLGGRIALVAAAQLEAAGREIERLLILDSPAVTPPGSEGAEMAAGESPMSLREEYWEWRGARAKHAKAVTAALIVARRLLRPRWAPLLRWIARHRRAVLPRRLYFYLNFQLRERMLLNLSDHWHRSLRIVPRISAPIMVFQAQPRDHKPACDMTAWRRHSPDVTVVAVGGNHFTMFDPPHLADLCARFTAASAAKSGEHGAAS